MALFKDNKLRLLLTLVGFTRLGANDDPDASWMIPSNLTSTELQQAIDLIRKYEFDPPTYDDGKGPEDMLRSKAAAARRSARRVDWDEEDDGVEGEDRGEYALDEPTARKADGAGKKILKRRRRERTPVELDDEEKEERANSRRQREIEKQLKVKSTMFVHDSDEEDDPEADAIFFAREEALRAQTKANIAKSLVLGNTEPAASKKRKGDSATEKVNKKRKSPPKQKQRAGPFGSDSDEEEADSESEGSPSSRAQSEQRQVYLDDSGDETTDTPLSSQLASAAELPAKSARATSADRDVIMADADDDEEDEVVTVRRPARNTRAGFVIDSDSE